MGFKTRFKGKMAVIGISAQPSRNIAVMSVAGAVRIGLDVDEDGIVEIEKTAVLTAHKAR